LLRQLRARRRPELSASIVRWAGLAAMFGGALFVVSAVMISSMPRGCIGDECGTRPMRETGAAGVLLTLALLLVVVGMAGLVIRARHAGRFGVLGKTGAVVAAAGAALPMIGGLIQGIVYGGDYPLVPYFVVPGVLALVVGFVLLGIAVLLAGVCVAALDGGAARGGLPGDARVQRPERPGVAGHPERYRVGGGRVRALVRRRWFYEKKKASAEMR
jgi:hypothetical protein